MGTLLALGITCQGPGVGFEVQGGLEEGVVIAISDLSRDNNGIVLTEFVVRDARTGDLVWHLEGRADVRTVTYGVVPKGLHALKDAVPLLAGEAYVLVARGISKWGAEPFGTHQLLIDESGAASLNPRY